MTTRTSAGIYLQVLEPAAAAAIGIEIDVYDAANLARMLDTLEAARNVSYQKQLNQAGAGTFKINRHDAKATAQNTQKGNLCKVKIDGVYRGAFFMEETVRDFADPSGAGAEDNEIKGRGVMVYLERAVVYPTGWPATKLPDVTYTGATRGAILKDQIDQAKARGGLGAMTYDFTATVDSIGNPWTDTNTLTLHVGLNLFDLTQQLAALGTDFYMDPMLGFHAYQSLSIDRTGASGAAAVVFRQGKHIGQTALTVDEHNSAVRSRLLVEGSGNNIQEVVDIPIETDATVGRREGYLSYTSSGDTQALNDAGEALMQQMADDAQPLSMTITHGLSSAGTGEYEPFVDYDVGDYGLVDVPGAYDLAALRLVGLTIDQIDGGDFTVTGDFNSVYLEALIRIGQKTSGLTGGSSGSGSAPGGGGAPAAGAGRVAAAVGDSPGYLYDKITAGTGIAKALLGSAPSETVGLSIVDLRLAAIPPGGTAGQALEKIDATDYHTSWVTPSGGGGGGSSENEAVASVLVNATSAGDAGNRADHFLGSSLAAAWTRISTAPLQQVVANSALAIVSAVNIGAVFMRSYTPTGILRLEARMALPTNGGSCYAELGLTTATGATNPDVNGEGMVILYDSTPELRLHSIDTGVTTTRVTTVMPIAIPQGWFYLRLDRDGANNWTQSWSLDRVVWVSSGTYAKTFSPASMFFQLRSPGTTPTSIDFVDVIT